MCISDIMSLYIYKVATKSLNWGHIIPITMVYDTLTSFFLIIQQLSVVGNVNNFIFTLVYGTSNKLYSYKVGPPNDS